MRFPSRQVLIGALVCVAATLNCSKAEFAVDAALMTPTTENRTLPRQKDKMDKTQKLRSRMAQRTWTPVRCRRS